jgi:hypothetical protein
MQAAKKPLREALNLRIDDALAREIERIARDAGQTESEVARRLLGYGVEVARRLEAQRLLKNYDQQLDPDTAGRIAISAEFVPYTWQEAGEISENLAAGGEASPRHPKWDDLIP